MHSQQLTDSVRWSRFPRLATDAALVVAGVALLALSAQIKVYLPFTPVPVTAQTLGLFVVAGMFGTARGTLAVWTYVMLGTFAPAVMAGPAPTLFGATGGYILSWLPIAFIIGVARERGCFKNWIATAAVFTASTALILAMGATWLAVLLQLSPEAAITLGVLPFLPGAVIKIGLATAALRAFTR